MQKCKGLYCILSDLYGITLSSSKDGVLFLLAEPTQIQSSKQQYYGCTLNDGSEKSTTAFRGLILL
jgi:hypothetical protein